MADKITRVATRVYDVKPRTPVALTVTIGEGQVGGTSLIWEGEVTAEEEKLKNRPIGKSGEDLHGKVLTCTTTVKDVNQFTNKTAVTYTLDGGAQGKQDFPLDIEVSADGGYAVYMVTFVFI